MTQVYSEVDEESNELDMNWLNFEIKGSPHAGRAPDSRQGSAQNGTTARSSVKATVF